MCGRERGEAACAREEVDDEGAEGKWVDEGSRSSAPPSRERETWILVSFVLRSMKAVRAGREVSGMVLGE